MHDRQLINLINSKPVESIFITQLGLLVLPRLAANNSLGYTAINVV